VALLAGLAVAACVARRYLLVAHGRFWRTDVVLVDNESTDGTSDAAMAVAGDRLDRLTIVRVSPTPAGWAGKVWAMKEGAARADGVPYILFADADIALAPGLVAGQVRVAEADGFDLVSQMALLHVASFWERALSGLRLLLHPAVSVPSDQPACLANGRGGGRMHAGATSGAGACWRTGADPRRGDRRRRAGASHQGRIGPGSPVAGPRGPRFGCTGCVRSGGRRCPGAR
jgi:glycosyltransferase involved in cell wall biosynthesis